MGSSLALLRGIEQNTTQYESTIKPFKNIISVQPLSNVPGIDSDQLKY